MKPPLEMPETVMSLRSTFSGGMLLPGSVWAAARAAAAATATAAKALRAMVCGHLATFKTRLL